MSPVKILFQFGNGDVEVDIVIFVKNSGDEVDEDAVGCILVSSERNFHSSKFHSPSDLIINRYF